MFCWRPALGPPWNAENQRPVLPIPSRARNAGQVDPAPTTRNTSLRARGSPPPLNSPAESVTLRSALYSKKLEKEKIKKYGAKRTHHRQLGEFSSQAPSAVLH